MACGAGRHMAALEARGLGQWESTCRCRCCAGSMRSRPDLSSGPTCASYPFARGRWISPSVCSPVSDTSNTTPSTPPPWGDAGDRAGRGMVRARLSQRRDGARVVWSRRRLCSSQTATVQITRAITDDGRFVIKTIQTPDGRKFRERVRLFTAPELENMIQAHGPTVVGRWGDYAGGRRVEGPRCILLARLAATIRIVTTPLPEPVVLPRCGPRPLGARCARPVCGSRDPTRSRAGYRRTPSS